MGLLAIGRGLRRKKIWMLPGITREMQDWDEGLVEICSHTFKVKWGLLVNMVVNMVCLLLQPHQNYNKNIEQLSLRTIRNRGEWKSDAYGIKDTHLFRLVEGTEMWNGLVAHPCVVDKNPRGISQEWGVLAPHKASSPGILVPGR